MGSDRFRVHTCGSCIENSQALLGRQQTIYLTRMAFNLSWQDLPKARTGLAYHPAQLFCDLNFVNIKMRKIMPMELLRSYSHVYSYSPSHDSTSVGNKNSGSLAAAKYERLTKMDNFQNCSRIEAVHLENMCTPAMLRLDTESRMGA